MDREEKTMWQMKVVRTWSLKTKMLAVLWMLMLFRTTRVEIMSLAKAPCSNLLTSTRAKSRHPKPRTRISRKGRKMRTFKSQT